MHRSGSIRHEAKCRVSAALDVGLWFGILVKVAEELVSVYLKGRGTGVSAHITCFKPLRHVYRDCGHAAPVLVRGKERVGGGLSWANSHAAATHRTCPRGEDDVRGVVHVPR